MTISSPRARVRAVVATIAAVALPALGCGLGGLDWNDVYPMIVAAAERMPDVRMQVYLPS